MSTDTRTPADPPLCPSCSPGARGSSLPLAGSDSLLVLLRFFLPSPSPPSSSTFLVEPPYEFRCSSARCTSEAGKQAVVVPVRSCFETRIQFSFEETQKWRGGISYGCGGGAMGRGVFIVSRVRGQNRQCCVQEMTAHTKKWPVSRLDPRPPEITGETHSELHSRRGMIYVGRKNLYSWYGSVSASCTSTYDTFVAFTPS